MPTQVFQKLTVLTSSFFFFFLAARFKYELISMLQGALACRTFGTEFLDFRVRVLS